MTDDVRRSRHQSVGLYLGPSLCLTMILFGVPDDLSASAWYTAAIGILMAVWWATEAIPIAATAMVPLVLFPLFGIANMSEAAAPFANKVIYLFLGGFVVALAMQRWNLHRRIALSILQRVGGSGRSLIGGFMLASALLSMWVMNTSTTMMLLPIAVSVVGVIHDSVHGLSKSQKSDFQFALLLGVAYGSTIGGIATLVGTAPNAMMAAFVLENYGTEIDFAHWMLVGLPLSAVMLPLSWFILTHVVFKVEFSTSGSGRILLRQLKDDMGPISVPEKRIAVVFVLMAFAWIFRPLVVKFTGLQGLDDSGIAIAGMLAMFLIPSGKVEDPMMLRWSDVEKLPWSILLLFGGGLSLAAAVSNTGLAAWIGTSITAISALPVAFVIISIVLLIIFLTELTSNIATTATFMPVVGAIAIESGVDPIILLVPVTMAASCAFMLPVATPPNAIVFGSGLLTIPRMAKAGLALNILGVGLVTLVALLIVPHVF